MLVRLKLDTCGQKLKLSHWNALSLGDRQLLIDTPCQTDAEIAQYRQMLCDRVAAATGDIPKPLPIDPAPPWEQPQVPDSVQQNAQSHHMHLTAADWQHLTPLQRFALIKLSRSNHENSNFLPALTEFGLNRG